MVVYGSHVSNSVHPPPPFLLGGGGIELPTKFSKRGVTYFRGVAIFTRKINENLKYLITKKSLEAKIFFSFITKNSYWEILTKNFVACF